MVLPTINRTMSTMSQICWATRRRQPSKICWFQRCWLTVVPGRVLQLSTCQPFQSSVHEVESYHRYRSHIPTDGDWNSMFIIHIYIYYIYILYIIYIIYIYYIYYIYILYILYLNTTWETYIYIYTYVYIYMYRFNYKHIRNPKLTQ